jgi:hypothetical protein
MVRSGPQHGTPGARSSGVRGPDRGDRVRVFRPNWASSAVRRVVVGTVVGTEPLTELSPPIPPGCNVPVVGMVVGTVVGTAVGTEPLTELSPPIPPVFCMLSVFHCST